MDAAFQDYHGEEDVEKPQPRNRTELYQLFNQKGPTNMVAGFMQDRELKLVARMIIDISYPLEKSYYETLKCLSAGWNAQCKWVSGRSVGSWLRTVTDILKVLESESLHNHLEMTESLRLEMTPEPCEWPMWAKAEEETLDQAFDFAVSLAGHWLWANIHFWLEFPSLLATVLHPDPNIAEMAFQHMEKLATAVNLAETSERVVMQELFSDLGWHRQQLARVAMALTLQGKKESLKKLARRSFKGSPSTKDCLENCFGFLHRKAQVNSTNQKLADMTKYLYTIISPYAESGGLPQILPSATDVDTLRSPQGFAAREQAHRELFSPQSSLFPNPQAVPKPGKGLSWKLKMCFPRFSISFCESSK